MDKTILFDLDDTLAPCQPYYDKANRRFCDFTTDRLGSKALTPERIRQVQLKVDFEALKRLGLARKERYADSMVLAYELLCREAGSEADEDSKQKVFEIGMSVFDQRNYENGMFPGARETLEFLAANGDKLILLTQGCLEVQEAKIAAYGIEGCFSEIHIVSEKTVERFRAFSRDGPTYMVGDSIRSDINPATEAGLRAIHIPTKTWDFDNQEIRHPSRVLKFKRITDIESKYHLL
jgi:putative hydrolase of the HAD superfamily